MLNDVFKNKTIITVIAVAWTVSIALSIYANTLRIKEYKAKKDVWNK